LKNRFSSKSLKRVTHSLLGTQTIWNLPTPSAPVFSQEISSFCSEWFSADSQDIPSACLQWASASAPGGKLSARQNESCCWAAQRQATYCTLGG